MNAVLTKQLTDRFKFIHTPKDRNDWMAFGFECNDGWYQLLFDTFEKLEAVNFDGEVIVVKEKFGSLRIYITDQKKYFDDKVYDILSSAEATSFKICELCGSDKGHMHSNRCFIQTLCDSCAKTKKMEPLNIEAFNN